MRVAKQLRVLIITAAYPSAGSHRGAFLAREVDGLRAQGIDVTVLHLQGQHKYLQGIRQVIQMTAGDHFDIVHGQYSFGGAVALAQRRLPTVISFWGTDVLRDPIQPDTFPNRVSRTISPWLARKADAVTVPFYKMADVLHCHNVTLIPHGIDFTLFHPMPQAEARQAVGLASDLDQRYILFCADPAWPRKGYDVLDAAVALMRANGERAEIVVANGLPHERIVTYMNACDLLAVPSSLESGPYVVKEAMACNLPIVATDVGDIAAIIGGTAGCAIAARTPEAFAHQMTQCLHGIRRTQGTQQIAHLSSEKLIASIIAVYEQVLRKRGTIGAGQCQPTA